MSLHPLDRLSILLVGGTESQRLGLRDYLGLWGARRVVGVADGRRAVEALSLERIDAVLADWTAPPAGAGELLQWLRQSPALRRDLRIVVLTAQTDVSTVRTIWQAGADAVLAKPAAPAVIARRIEAVMRSAPRIMPLAARPAERPKPQLSKPATATPQLSGCTRLGIILERLEGLVREKVPNPGALRIVVAELQAATAGTPVMEDMARSLARCVQQVSPLTPGFTGALRAHLAGLRWLAVRTEDTPVGRSLVASLAAGVDAMIDQQSIRRGGPWGESPIWETQAH